MAALLPPVKPKIVKKRTEKFIRQQSDRHVKIKRNWWKLRGIDKRVRRRFKGQILMSNIGYGSSKKTKHMLPSGFREVSGPQCQGAGSAADVQQILLC
ncbi:60S ribosomal protein L32 [Sigmodon hispidus]